MINFCCSILLQGLFEHQKQQSRTKNRDKMYIGPWQEFKLAKILQIKDKMEKEEEEEQNGVRYGNGSPNLSYMHGNKAYSVNNGRGYRGVDDMSASNFSGYSHPVYGAGQMQQRIVSGVTQYSNFT